MTPKSISGQSERESVGSDIDRLGKHCASLAIVAKKAAQMQARPDEFGLHNAVGELLDGVKSLQQFVPLLEVVQAESLVHTDRLILELEANLRKACEEQGWRLEGVWPSLYVERGIHILIDEKKRAALIGGQRLASLAISEIVRRLQPLVRDLLPKAFSSAAFLTSLAAAYDDAKTHPRQVPIFEIYRTVVIRAQSERFWRDAGSSAFSGISADQFRARFSRMLEEGPTAASDGRLLRLLPPLKAEDGLYIYQPAESRFGFIGRIEFVPPDATTL